MREFKMLTFVFVMSSGKKRHIEEQTVFFPKSDVHIDLWFNADANI